MDKNRGEAPLNEESGYLAHSIQDHLEQHHFDADRFEQLTSCLLLCDSVRLKCLVQADELNLARSTARGVGTTYTELFDSISATRLADQMTRSSAEQSTDDLTVFRKHEQTAQLITDHLQEVTDVTISKPLLIDHLIENKVKGSLYLAEISALDQHPIVLLTT